MPQIDTEYIKTGKLRHAFKDLPLESIHPNAFRAAVAAECAGEQGKYWEMHEVLFKNEKQLGADQLPAYATTVGLNAEKFSKDGGHTFTGQMGVVLILIKTPERTAPSRSRSRSR